MKTWKKRFESSSWYESYEQEEDTSSPRTDLKVQELSLEAIDVCSNEHYLVISTQRWALDVEDIDDFCQLLKDFMNRELKQKKIK
jgi:hypothetical protein